MVEQVPPDQGQRPVTLQEALRCGQYLQRTEQFAEAESVYTAVLEQVPDEPNALHFLGILRHQQGKSEEAMRLIRRAAELMPTEAGPWNNLGNVLIENERYSDAIDAFKRCTEIAPGFVQAYNNLGILHTRCGQWEPAERCFKHALEIAPKVSYLYHNYARLLFCTHRLKEAAAYGLKTLVIEPTRPTARKLLSMSYYLLGQVDEARKTLNDWLALEPGNPEALHHLAACGGIEVPARASDAYVRSVFDGFAASFDVQLERLDYQAPQLVHAALQRVVGGGVPPCGAVLDAGCGTGLCGPMLRPLAGRLDGVDLSEGMLALARQRGQYDSLHHAELTAYLQKHTDTYDAIVSADTLCYFGDLASFMTAAHTALRAQGVMVFSLEALLDAQGEFVLQVHGRYAHARSYVEAELARAGFEQVVIEQHVLRNESIAPVQGWIVSAARGEGAA